MTTATKKTYALVNLNGDTMASGLEGKVRVLYWAQRSGCFLVKDQNEGAAKGTPSRTTVYPVEV